MTSRRLVQGRFGISGSTQPTGCDGRCQEGSVSSGFREARKADRLPILLCVLSLLTALLSGTLHETRLVDFKFHHTD
jgi:hypothetical protein